MRGAGWLSLLGVYWHPPKKPAGLPGRAHRPPQGRRDRRRGERRDAASADGNLRLEYAGAGRTDFIAAPGPWSFAPAANASAILVGRDVNVGIGSLAPGRLIRQLVRFAPMVSN